MVYYIPLSFFNPHLFLRSYETILTGPFFYFKEGLSTLSVFVAQSNGRSVQLNPEGSALSGFYE